MTSAYVVACKMAKESITLHFEYTPEGFVTAAQSMMSIIVRELCAVPSQKVIQGVPGYTACYVHQGVFIKLWLGPSGSALSRIERKGAAMVSEATKGYVKIPYCSSVFFAGMHGTAMSVFPLHDEEEDKPLANSSICEATILSMMHRVYPGIMETPLRDTWRLVLSSDGSVYSIGNYGWVCCFPELKDFNLLSTTSTTLVDHSVNTAATAKKIKGTAVPSPSSLPSIPLWCVQVDPHILKQCEKSSQSHLLFRTDDHDQHNYTSPSVEGMFEHVLPTLGKQCNHDDDVRPRRFTGLLLAWKMYYSTYYDEELLHRYQVRMISKSFSELVSLECESLWIQGKGERAVRNHMHERFGQLVSQQHGTTKFVTEWLLPYIRKRYCLPDLCGACHVGIDITQRLKDAVWTRCVQLLGIDIVKGVVGTLHGYAKYPVVSPSVQYICWKPHYIGLTSTYIGDIILTCRAVFADVADKEMSAFELRRYCLLASRYECLANDVRHAWVPCISR
eukprot:PhF_6_TR7998/c0_g1_i4/m.12324